MLETKDSRPNARRSIEFNQHGPAAFGLSPNIGGGIHAIGAKFVASFGPNSYRITTLDRAARPAGAVELVTTTPCHSRNGSGFPSYSIPKRAIDS